PPHPPHPTPTPIKHLPQPPIKLKGTQHVNQFVTQKEHYNVITWSAPLEGSKPVEYHIYIDSDLKKNVAKVSAEGQLRFEDHNLKKGKEHSYYIVSVDKAGKVSKAAKVVVYHSRSKSHLLDHEWYRSNYEKLGTND
nr:hypothetical protein [Parachlamydiaceae bacterium]